MLLLKDETPTKTFRELGELCGVSVAYLSQIKSNKIDRGMGDDVARRLEQGMKKPTGWIDVQQGRNSKGLAKQITAEETKLIEAYRECSPAARETIFTLCHQLRGNK